MGDVFDAVMQAKKETELKLKADLLKELYDFLSVFKFCCSQNKELGNIFVLRHVEHCDGTDVW